MERRPAKRSRGSGPPLLGKGPVLIALEGPQYTSAAMRAARIVCRYFGMSATLIHVSDPPLSLAALVRHLGLTPETMQDVVVKPLAGEPVREIPRQSRKLEASLLIMGLPAHPGAPGLGPIREIALLEVACPVLFVPARIRAHWGEEGSILLPLDGTPSTSSASPLAAELAHKMSATLEVLHVAAAPSAEPGSMSLPRFVDQPQHEWEMWRREFLSRIEACCGNGVTVELHLSVKLGSPADAILETADRYDVDLITLGWHGLMADGHAATLQAVLLQAKCPVLTLRV